MTKPLGIVIFACLTKQKYRQQVEDCYATWVQDALQAGCVVRFYCEEIPADLSEGLKALCENVQFGDGYHSALFKQWRGLENMFYSLEPCEWYFTCGTDTFLNVSEGLKMLAEYSGLNKSLCIGGNEGCETVAGTSYKYFSGGAGIFMNASAVDAMCDKLPEFMQWWVYNGVVIQEEVKDDCVIRTNVFGASDMQIGILCKWLDIQEISVGIEKMNGSDSFKEAGQRIVSMISIHNLQHDDFYECARLLNA